MPVEADEAFAFFADAWNLEAITPPWLRFRILEAPRAIQRGSLLVYRLRLFGVPIRWQTEIIEWRPPFGFTDVQLSGQDRRWEHTHRLRPVDGGTEIHDCVLYRLPYEPLAGLLAPVAVRPWLSAILDFRARQTRALLQRERRLASRFNSPPPTGFSPDCSVSPPNAPGSRWGRSSKPATVLRGVCVTFRSPVCGIDRAGRIRHPELTVTVRDVDGLLDALAHRNPERKR